MKLDVFEKSTCPQLSPVLSTKLNSNQINQATEYVVGFSDCIPETLHRCHRYET